VSAKAVDVIGTEHGQCSEPIKDCLIQSAGCIAVS